MDGLMLAGGVLAIEGTKKGFRGNPVKKYFELRRRKDGTVVLLERAAKDSTSACVNTYMVQNITVGADGEGLCISHSSTADLLKLRCSSAWEASHWIGEYSGGGSQHLQSPLQSPPSVVESLPPLLAAAAAEATLHADVSTLQAELERVRREAEGLPALQAEFHDLEAKLHAEHCALVQAQQRIEYLEHELSLACRSAEVAHSARAAECRKLQKEAVLARYDKRKMALAMLRAQARLKEHEGRAQAVEQPIPSSIATSPSMPLSVSQTSRGIRLEDDTLHELVYLRAQLKRMAEELHSAHALAIRTSAPARLSTESQSCPSCTSECNAPSVPVPVSVDGTHATMSQGLPLAGETCSTAPTTSQGARAGAGPSFLEQRVEYLEYELVLACRELTDRGRLAADGVSTERSSLHQQASVSDTHVQSVQGALVCAKTADERSAQLVEAPDSLHMQEDVLRREDEVQYLHKELRRKGEVPLPPAPGHNTCQAPPGSAMDELARRLEYAEAGLAGLRSPSQRRQNHEEGGLQSPFSPALSTMSGFTTSHMSPLSRVDARLARAERALQHALGQPESDERTTPAADGSSGVAALGSSVQAVILAATALAPAGAGGVASSVRAMVCSRLGEALQALVACASGTSEATVGTGGSDSAVHQAITSIVSCVRAGLEAKESECSRCAQAPDSVECERKVLAAKEAGEKVGRAAVPKQMADVRSEAAHGEESARAHAVRELERCKEEHSQQLGAVREECTDGGRAARDQAMTQVREVEDMWQLRLRTALGEAQQQVEAAQRRAEAAEAESASLLRRVQDMQGRQQGHAPAASLVQAAPFDRVDRYSPLSPMEAPEDARSAPASPPHPSGQRGGGMVGGNTSSRAAAALEAGSFSLQDGQSTVGVSAAPASSGQHPAAGLVALLLPPGDQQGYALAAALAFLALLWMVQQYVKLW